VLAWEGFGIWALVGSLLGGEATRSALSYWLKPWRPSLRLDWGAVRELARFSRWVMASNAAVFIGLQLDSAVVAKLISPAALGFYQVANRLAALPRATVVTVLSEVAYPAMSAAQEDAARLRKLLLGFWLASVVFAGGFELGLVLFARPVITFVLGGNWAGAAPLAVILGLAQFLRAAAVIPSYYFLATGRPGVTFQLSAARAAGLAAVIWPLAAVWDAAGAAWAAVAGAGAMTAVWVVAMGRRQVPRAASDECGAAAAPQKAPARQGVGE
jgi:O-antigen/teichoic acid export membrane protein